MIIIIMIIKKKYIIFFIANSIWISFNNTQKKTEWKETLWIQYEYLLIIKEEK